MRSRNARMSAIARLLQQRTALPWSLDTRLSLAQNCLQAVGAILSARCDQSVGETLSRRILFCRVVRFRPRRSAAPPAPAILPEVAFRALMMACRSASWNVDAEQ